MSCWRLELPTDWDQYFASLGKHLRRDARRLERELLARPGDAAHGDAAGRTAAGDGDSRRFAPAAAEDVGREGLLRLGPFRGLLPDVVPELLRRGRVQLYWLEFDGRPVAAEYHLVGDGMLYVYQSGMEPELLEQNRAI